MITCQQLVTSLQQTQLNDPDGTTFTQEQLIVALNSALGMLCLLRPDATAKSAVIVMQRGARQQIPDDGARLIRVIANVRESGVTGQVIRLVQKADLDSSSLKWMAAYGTHVKEYMFDPRVPKQFFIYPTVPPSVKVEIEYSANPRTITADNFDKALPVDAMYEQPIQELMMYKLLSGDATNGNSGATHLQMATELLGVQSAQDERLSNARKSSS